MKENGCCQNAALFINLTTLRGVSVIDVPSNSTKHSTADTIERILWAVAISMMLFAFCLYTPSGIFQGIWRIILHPDGLITDYSSVGGFGATFFNAGLIMAASIIIVKLSHAMISGPTIACIFLMAGFAMFGKNVANIWPIILGVFLFSKVNHESFSKYVYIALYATALSPLITAVAIESESMLQKLIVVIVFGAVIGFLTPPLATYCLRVHQGYNLYNVGFAAGLVGTLIVSVMKSFGFEITTSLVWTYENNPLVVGYMYLLSTILMVAGWWMTPDKRSLKRIYRHSGRLVADFILLGKAQAHIGLGLHRRPGQLYEIGVPLGDGGVVIAFPVCPARGRALAYAEAEVHAYGVAGDEKLGENYQLRPLGGGAGYIVQGLFHAGRLVKEGRLGLHQGQTAGIL